MKNYFPYIVVISILFLLSVYIVDYKDQIEILHQELEEIDRLNKSIDSLMLEIDTLEYEAEIWDYNIENNTTHLLSAIMFIESSNDDSAYHKGEDAVGCLQIRKTMVDDVNRILKRQKSKKYFHYEDRWNRVKSIQMFDIYCKHYNLNTAEEIARCWNGGPRGIDKPETISYWQKVKAELSS